MACSCPVPALITSLHGRVRWGYLEVVRAENPIHGSDQQSCRPGAPAVMITHHVCLRFVCATRRWCAVRRWESKEVRDLLAGLSQQPGRSWAQSDPGDAGEGGKQR